MEDVMASQSQAQFLGGKPCLSLLASGSLKQVSYSLCLGYRSGKNVLLVFFFKSVGAWIPLCSLWTCKIGLLTNQREIITSLKDICFFPAFDYNELDCWNGICLCFFTDSQFPIDISPVKKDHDFLDKDLVEPLCR